MLSIPNSDGWARFQLHQTREYSLSYTDDIPFEWIRQAIHGLESKNPICVIGETEPGTLLCIVGWDTHILWEEDRDSVRAGKIKHEYSDVNMLEFARQLYNDVSTDFAEWVKFNWISDSKNAGERKEELERLLARLKELIDGKN